MTTRLRSDGGSLVLPLQPTSLDIWRSKYRLHDGGGRPIDETPDDTLKRVARTLAVLESRSEQWYPEFLWALRQGAIPAGRILSNADALAYKPATSTINCTVSGTIEDSMDDILAKVREAGLTLKAGCGIGYDFSTMRPKGAPVAGAGAATSGPLSFMDIFDKMCSTISSAGGRRGAQMGVMDVRHPDVIDFIRAKREDGRLRQFNLSLLITEAFIDAVREDREWALIFPWSEAQLKSEGSLWKTPLRWCGPTGQRGKAFTTRRGRWRAVSIVPCRLVVCGISSWLLPTTMVSLGSF